MLTTCVYLGLGSNIGDREEYLQVAQELLESYEGIHITSTSSVIETDPIGNTEQGMFLNQVIEIETTLAPREMLDVCLEIEKQQHRIRGERWAPRTLDIDILFFGDQIIDEHGLRIPHPEAHARGFVLKPLAEIAPKFEHPVIRQRIGAMAQLL